MKAVTASRSQSVSATSVSTAIFWASIGLPRTSSSARPRELKRPPVNPALTLIKISLIQDEDQTDKTTHAQNGRSRILHHAVIDLAEPQRDDIERIVLVEPPRPPRALLRQFLDRALHVA